MVAPRKVASISKNMRRPARSATAPSKGAPKAIKAEAIVLAIPSRKVLSVTSTPTLQYCLKNTGKNPAITVVANAELAQSTRAQDQTGRRNSTARRSLAVFMQQDAPVFRGTRRRATAPVSAPNSRA